jgi:hypothetical protein
LNPANLNFDGSHSPKQFSGEDEQPWLDDMAESSSGLSEFLTTWSLTNGRTLNTPR